MLSGDANNGGATALTTVASTSASDRGYRQAFDDYRTWLEAHTNATPGYYISGSAVSTPHGVLERGLNAGYPFALTPLDKDFTNGWAVTASDNNLGNLRLTIAAPKSPPSAWERKIRVAIFGHSNPSYCLDQHLDKSSTDSLNRRGGSGLRRLHGYNSLATSGTASQLTDTTTPGGSFPPWLVGWDLYFETGANAGLRRKIKSVSGASINVDPAFPSAIALNDFYRAGSLAYTIEAVTASTITLRTDYRAANGSGGAIMIMGKLATSGNSITKGNSFPGGGGDYTRITMEVDHGLAVGDYLVILGTNYPSNPSANPYNCTRSGVVDGSGGITVHKVVTIISATSVDVELPYPGNVATGGRWYGTCLTLLPTDYAGSQSEKADEGRIDTPDHRRTDVRTLFVNKQKSLIGDLFTRHGARHLGVFDECSFRQATSAASNAAILTSYAGETTDQIIDRVGLLGDWLQSEWCRKLTANTTAYLTQDTLSEPQLANVASRWGGLMSEGACALFDRSVHQMIGGPNDGYLRHLETLLAAGGRYYYQPQDIDEDTDIKVVPLVAPPTNSTKAGGVGNAYLTITTQFDPGLLPNVAESEFPYNGNPHNHSGDIIGIYGHSVAAVNGVHRVIRRQTTDTEVSLETRWVSGLAGTGGTIVYHRFCAPMKITGLSNAGGKTRVTTEFPHFLPEATEDVSDVRIFGYSGAGLPVNNAVYRATKVNATQFDLLTLNYVSNPGPAICFFCRADTRHWLGLSYMLWQSGRAIEYSSGSLLLDVNTTRAYVTGLSPDGAYAATAFSGTCSYLSTTVIRDLSKNFTDAVLGEQVAFLMGTNAPDWRRVIARTATELTLDAAVGSTAGTSTYIVGKTRDADPEKVLQLGRNFNSGNRRVEVYPQKSAVNFISLH